MKAIFLIIVIGLLSGCAFSQSQSGETRRFVLALDLVHASVNGERFHDTLAGNLFLGYRIKQVHFGLNIADRLFDDAGQSNTRVDLGLIDWSASGGFRVHRFLDLELGLGITKLSWKAHNSNNCPSPDHCFDSDPVHEKTEHFYVQAASQVWRHVRVFVRHTQREKVKDLLYSPGYSTLDLGVGLRWGMGDR